MGDDGNRQVALTLSEVAVVLGLNSDQFDALDTKLGGIEDAVNKLGEDDTNISAEIESLKQEVVVGFAGVNRSIANLNNTVHERAVDLAKWLAAIALAAANPADNTAEVQKKVDEIAASLNTSAQEQENALNQTNQLKET